jgi:hypothetical protein
VHIPIHISTLKKRIKNTIHPSGGDKSFHLTFLSISALFISSTFLFTTVFYCRYQIHVPLQDALIPSLNRKTVSVSAPMKPPISILPRKYTGTAVLPSFGSALDLAVR